MKTAVSCLALFLATPAFAQTVPQDGAAPAPARPGSDLTRLLNGAPPATAAAPATTAPPVATPIPAPPAAAPGAVPIPPSTPTSRPRATPITPPASAPRTTPPTAAPASPPPRLTPPSTVPSRPPSSSTPAATPAPATSSPVPAATSPAAPAAPSVLTPAAVAALPFTVDLPPGFQITTGRPGPDFRIYAIRRGQQPFVMVYAGPASQFPIYTGETAVVGPRTSVVVVEGNERHAVEHLFQSESAPRELHVWVSSLEGADRVLGERIAQSIDVR